MSGFDDNATVVGDWIAHSPSLTAVFESFSSDSIRSRSTIVNHPESQTKTVFARIAVRAGLNVPTLNTGSISRPDEVLLNNTHARPLYFTIPPGLSPTTLLESPGFHSSSWAQQSPTTGKFQFSPGSFATNSTLNEETQSKNGNQFEKIDSTLFSFRPVLESGHSSFLGDSNKITTVHESNIFPSRTEKEHPKMIYSESEASHYLPVDFHRGNTANSHRRVIDTAGGSVANSSPLDEEANEMGGGDATRVDACEDGYNWRKYGQKQVKGSDYPRSYYRCTHSSCTVKKKVERSHEGHITEIIYKGAHNHSKPHPNRGSILGPIDPRSDNNVQTGVAFEGSSAFSYDDDDDEDGSDLKRRKIDEYVSETSGATRAIKKPKVVVQTMSQVDILDDGYHWRKYGQKVVKGNPNPRSYYKCTSPGCIVRKHIERASHDLNSVITMYEGKHNHDVPAARNNGYSNVGSPDNRAAQVGKPVSISTHLHTPEQSQVHNVSRFSRTTAMNSLDFGCETGLANMVMARLGHDHGPSIQHQFGCVSEMGFMLPKGEPNLDPLSEPPLMSIPDSSSAYSLMRNL